jgi:hypothetical protein
MQIILKFFHIELQKFLSADTNMQGISWCLQIHFNQLYLSPGEHIGCGCNGWRQLHDQVVLLFFIGRASLKNIKISRGKIGGYLSSTILPSLWDFFGITISYLTYSHLYEINFTDYRSLITDYLFPALRPKL